MKVNGTVDMTIRFEFELSDTDAENLMDIMNKEKTRCQMAIIKCIGSGNKAEADWYRRHVDYIDELKKKILAGQKSTSSVV